VEKDFMVNLVVVVTDIQAPLALCKEIYWIPLILNVSIERQDLVQSI
jgi:hypothetical protein